MAACCAFLRLRRRPRPSSAYFSQHATARSSPTGCSARAATANRDFDRLCANLGIEHRLTPPMRPQTNGMIERFNGRIEDILRATGSEAQRDLKQTHLRNVRLYNGRLPQFVFKGRAPIDTLKAWHHKRPEIFNKRPYNHPRWDR